MNGLCGSPYSNGTLFVTDRSNYIVRMLVPVAGGGYNVTTLAGGGTAKTVNGVGTNAFFNLALNCVVDPSMSVLYVTGTDASVRTVTIPSPLVGAVAQTSTVSTWAGGVPSAAGAVTNGWADAVGTNALFGQTIGMALDPTNTFMYVSDCGQRVIKRIVLANATVQTISGTHGVAGGTDGVNALWNCPRGLAVDPTNTYLYAGEYGGGTVRRLELATNNVVTIAGTYTTANLAFSEGLGTANTFYQLTGVAIDPQGNLILADNSHGYMRKMHLPSGLVTVIGGIGTNPTAANLVNFGPALSTPMDPQMVCMYPRQNPATAPNPPANSP